MSDIPDIIELLFKTIEVEGSDLHITPDSEPIVRVKGELQRLDGSDKLTENQVHNLIYSILSDDQKKRLETKKEIDLSIELSEIGSFRVNIFFNRRGKGAVFRMIPVKIPTLQELGIAELERFTELEKGLVIVTGPAGTGKSTSLAAIINMINHTRNFHVITIEDPVEFLHNHNKSLINQREVGRDTDSFPNALRSALREDPDVILVGEMRDLETISLSITAAETGHLVFATLHTGSCAQAVSRIIDVFPPVQQSQIRTQLSISLEGVISQILIPSKDNSGYMGRVCAIEIMIATPAIRQLIRDNKLHQIPSYIQSGQQYGMRSMDQSLVLLFAQNKITKEDILHYCQNKANVAGLLGQEI